MVLAMSFISKIQFSENGAPFHNLTHQISKDRNTLKTQNTKGRENGNKHENCHFGSLNVNSCLHLNSNVIHK